MFESTIKCKKKSHLTRTITNFVSNAPVIFEKAEQVNLNDDSILHLIMWGENIRCQDIGQATIFQILGVQVLFVMAIQSLQC